MNQAKNKSGFLQNLWNFIGKVSKAIVSGIPNEKPDLRPKQKSRVFQATKKMKSDEEHHGETARASGSSKLSNNLKNIMKITAGFMKFASYKI